MENKIIAKIENVDGKLIVSSRVIAEQLGKQHKHVLESIEKIIENSSAEISAQYILSSYKDKSGKSNKEYLLTEKGFILYMFNTQGYNEYKITYINEFDRMKQLITSKNTLLLDIINAKGEVNIALALNKYEEHYVRPLELENKEVKENLEATANKLEHKQEVINLLVEDVKIKTQRQFLIEIIQMKGSEQIPIRWNILYKSYEQNKHINLKARYEAYNLINKPKMKSYLEYIDLVLFDIPTLYKLATKIFESDFKDKLKKYTDAL